jgi:hypothetical protein
VYKTIIDTSEISRMPLWWHSMWSKSKFEPGKILKNVAYSEDPRGSVPYFFLRYPRRCSLRHALSIGPKRSLRMSRVRAAGYGEPMGLECNTPYFKAILQPAFIATAHRFTSTDAVSGWSVVSGAIGGRGWKAGRAFGWLYLRTTLMPWGRSPSKQWVPGTKLRCF